MKNNIRYEVVSHEIKRLGPIYLMPEKNDNLLIRLIKRVRLFFWEIYMWICWRPTRLITLRSNYENNKTQRH